MLPYSVIRRKRDGRTLDPETLGAFLRAFHDGELPDYQMSAFLMAVFFRGLSPAETHALTEAMVASGDTLDWRHLGRPAVDKHSTGGVGDKTSLVLVPLMAAAGLPFVKMSGRGLGHTARSTVGDVTDL
jgi:thymidine phosphorylase